MYQALFLFKGDDVFKLVGDLSGGERARLALLKLFLQGDNFLYLRTNRQTIQIFQRVKLWKKHYNNLKVHCFIISHDRYFWIKFLLKPLFLDDGKITEYLGNYSYYKEKLKNRKICQPQLTGQNLENSVSDNKHASINEPKLSVEKSTEESQKKPNAYMIEKQLAEVESEIARLRQQ